MTSREYATHICEVLRAAGHQAFFVGGCVRDLLLGREPADYDVATDAPPERIIDLFPGSLTVGAQFGVVLVVQGDTQGEAQEQLQVEVATFRSDVGYSDGRHPDRVVFTRTAQEDVQRRDFTINALLMDPRSGEILDFVGGREDLRTGIIRAIGEPEHRFTEDKLRLLRAVRFAARFGYAIEPATFAAIRKLAPEVTSVSAERLRDELTRLLTEGAARQAFELLDASGLLSVLLPEVARMKGVAQPPQFHPEGDVWVHTLLLLAKLPPGCPPALAWGALLHDVGKPPTFKGPSRPGDRIRFDGHAEVGTRMAEEICRRFRFSNEESEQVAALVANHMRFKDVTHMRASSLKRFVRLNRFSEHMELHRMDCLSSNGSLESYDFMNQFLATTPPEEVRPPRLLTGEDLMGLGLRPGPLFREILQEVEDAQLEGSLTNQAEALNFVRTKYV